MKIRRTKPGELDRWHWETNGWTGTRMSRRAAIRAARRIEKQFKRAEESRESL